jgi:hypothetical protein
LGKSLNKTKQVAKLSGTQDTPFTFAYQKRTIGVLHFCIQFILDDCTVFDELLQKDLQSAAKVAPTGSNCHLLRLGVRR